MSVERIRKLTEEKEYWVDVFYTQYLNFVENNLRRTFLRPFFDKNKNRKVYPWENGGVDRFGFSKDASQLVFKYRGKDETVFEKEELEVSNEKAKFVYVMSKKDFTGTFFRFMDYNIRTFESFLDGKKLENGRTKKDFEDDIVLVGETIFVNEEKFKDQEDKSLVRELVSLQISGLFMDNLVSQPVKADKFVDFVFNVMLNYGFIGSDVDSTIIKGQADEYTLYLGSCVRFNKELVFVNRIESRDYKNLVMFFSGNELKWGRTLVGNDVTMEVDELHDDESGTKFQEYHAKEVAKRKRMSTHGHLHPFSKTNRIGMDISSESKQKGVINNYVIDEGDKWVVSSYKRTIPKHMKNKERALRQLGNLI